MSKTENISPRRQEILKALRITPGAIAIELSATAVELCRMEDDGLVEKIGSRKTGKRGRPPVEWIVKDEQAVPVKQATGSVAPAPAAPIRVLPPKGASKLPEVPTALREAVDNESAAKLSYIERTFAGEFGQRDLGDYSILADEYKRILRRVSQKVNVTFTPEEI